MERARPLPNFLAAAQQAEPAAAIASPIQKSREKGHIISAAKMKGPSFRGNS